MVGSDRIFGTIGLALNSRVDQVISSAQFGGHGVGVSLGHERTRRTYQVRSSISASIATLAPIAGDVSSTERTYSTDLTLEVLRAMQPGSTSGVRLGAELRGSLFLTRHRYADPQRSMATFLVGTAAIGPAVSYHTSVAGGSGTIHLAIPMIGVVSHPYSGLKSDRRSLEFRSASLATLRSLSAGASFSAFESRRFGVRYEYALRLMRYDDVQPVRAVTQSMRVGVERRLGRTGR